MKNGTKSGYLMVVAIIAILGVIIYHYASSHQAKIDYLRACFDACYKSIIVVQKSDAEPKEFPDCITNLDLYKTGSKDIVFNTISNVTDIKANTIICRSKDQTDRGYMLLLGDGKIAWTNK
jgi:hypothetical protein